LSNVYSLPLLSSYDVLPTLFNGFSVRTVSDLICAPTIG
jgi:hypothetical protein